MKIPPSASRLTRRVENAALRASTCPAHGATVTVSRVSAKIAARALRSSGRYSSRAIAVGTSDLLMIRPSDEALAFWVTGPGSSQLRSETLPPPAAGYLRIRALYSGVSRGTESLVFNGHVPPTEYGRMRAPFQAGEFPAPVKYGYANVGRVVEGPADRVGQVVFCLYPHQSDYVVPAAEAYPIPDAVPPARAVLAANLETAINAVWDAGVGPGDRVTVVGAGSVGCLVAWLAARTPGCDVELVDTNPARAQIASAMGARFASPTALRGDADVVVHASE